ncbi:membrane protein of unknown function [Candidatus Saccharimonas aalborgensis]|uniref:Uncharacterized protein n=1 Tax=Candidatus Saccharimonas aalborgensis TaxID=1332188 RepID=R4PMQ5_9BACT|nr:hypothetical protein [Candidatus Saccharimonas aalborgensis]AGL62199.1 membrane protein of unknown function [Candidatus Saccharimonas aalborgensis]QQS68709.1 MAG: hypothetical protein IPP24_01610 [Candidatus Saccharibacteria bacterium]QQS70996.1 MAG: hypothetical protein IPP92_01710 [Candidatus Saccharibacteria bacterium]
MENGKIFQEEWGVGRNNNSNRLKPALLKFGYVPVVLLSIVMIVAELKVGRIESDEKTLHAWFQSILLTSIVFGIAMIYFALMAKHVTKRVLYIFCLLVCMGIGLLSYVNAWFFG